jgi:putative peptidoglycan lipid II flippase
VLTLAGQQLVALVAIRLANSGTPSGTQVVYTAGLTLFLVPWAALAVPLATSAYPGLAEHAEAGDDVGFRRALSPVAVVALVAAATAAAVLVAVAGPMARIFLFHEPAAHVAALRDTIIAFAPGLVGYGLVAVLTRALYARGEWKTPTFCVVGGWLLAVAADVALSAALPAADRGLALGAGHSIGVSFACVALLVAVGRAAGRDALAGTARVGGPALLAAVVAAGAGLALARILGADPVPHAGALATVGMGVLVGVVVLAVSAAVIGGTARRPLSAAVHALRSTGAHSG